MRKAIMTAGTIAALGVGIAVLFLAGRTRRQPSWLYMNRRPAWRTPEMRR